MYKYISGGKRGLLYTSFGQLGRNSMLGGILTCCSWVKSFVEAQGQVALTNTLAKINRRQIQGPAPAAGTTSDKDLDREYDIIKCLKALMNNKYGADDALLHQQVIISLATSLISPRLTTRKLVSEVLTSTLR